MTRDNVRRKYSVSARLDGQLSELKKHKGDRGVFFKDLNYHKKTDEQEWKTFLPDVSLRMIEGQLIAVADRIADSPFYEVEEFGFSTSDRFVRNDDPRNLSARQLAGNDGGPVVGLESFKTKSGVKVYRFMSYFNAVEANMFLTRAGKPITKWTIERVEFDPPCEMEDGKVVQLPLEDRVPISERSIDIHFPQEMMDRFTSRAKQKEPMPSKEELMKMICDHLDATQDKETAEELKEFAVQAMAVTFILAFGGNAKMHKVEKPKPTPQDDTPEKEENSATEPADDDDLLPPPLADDEGLPNEGESTEDEESSEEEETSEEAKKATG